MPLNDGVLDAVNNSNFKIVAEGPAVALSQALGLAALDAVSHQRIVNALREANLAEVLGQRGGVDPTEAIAQKSILESGLARTMNELGSQIAALQQTIKGAQSTPPVTVPPPAAGA